MQIIIYMKVFSWSTGLHIPITQWHWQWQWHCDAQPFFGQKHLIIYQNFGFVWQVSWCTNFLRWDETQRRMSCFRKKKLCYSGLTLIALLRIFWLEQKIFPEDLNRKIIWVLLSNVQYRGIANEFSQYFNMIAGVLGSFASNCGYLWGDDF